MTMRGPILFQGDQRRLVHGARLDVVRGRVDAKALARLRIGDLFWAREPWAMVKPSQYGGRGFQFALAGPPDAQRTDEQKAALRRAGEYRLVPQRAGTLAKSDSRATLEVMGIGEHAISLLVHMQQIDAFIAARRAA